MKLWFKILLGSIVLAFGAYYYIFKSNNIASQEPYILTIRENTPSKEIIEKLKNDGVLKNQTTFDFILNIKSFKTVPRGRYKLQSPMSNFQLISKLRNGYQDPVHFTLSTATFVEEIGSKIGSKLSFDSTQFINYLYSDTVLSKYNITKENALCHFFPNTIEMYWSISLPQFMQKFDKEKKKFWNQENIDKATKLNLTQNEVYILASLVQKEYTKKNERSKIAAVLLNRLQINMPLQVDATCKYATRDFTAKRVTQLHTTCASPYNTYKTTGLPPGPICMPETSTIEAVLNPDTHHYLYYCADPALNGYHIFSTTLQEHESIAHQYRTKMNELNIK